MNMTKTHTKHEIGPRGGMLLHDATGSMVKCLSGIVWLTMEGDYRDIVLEPGESFVVDHDGLTILAAQQPNAIEVSARPQGKTWWDHVVEFLDRNYGPAALRPSRKWVY